MAPSQQLPAPPTTAPLPRHFPGATSPGAAQHQPTHPVHRGAVRQRSVVDVAAAQVQRVGDKVWRSDLVGIADFAQPSWKPRLHFANLEAGTVRSFLLAHGKGSDPQHSGWLQSFSKVPGSEATSRGAYLTCEWYKGKYGTSIRLVGLDSDRGGV